MRTISTTLFKVRELNVNICVPLGIKGKFHDYPLISMKSKDWYNILTDSRIQLLYKPFSKDYVWHRDDTISLTEFDLSNLIELLKRTQKTIETEPEKVYIRNEYDEILLRNKTMNTIRMDTTYKQTILSKPEVVIRQNKTSVGKDEYYIGGSLIFNERKILFRNDELKYLIKKLNQIDLFKYTFLVLNTLPENLRQPSSENIKLRNEINRGMNISSTTINGTRSESNFIDGVFNNNNQKMSWE